MVLYKCGKQTRFLTTKTSGNLNPVNLRHDVKVKYKNSPQFCFPSPISY